jgi:hypothetical protein
MKPRERSLVYFWRGARTKERIWWGSLADPPRNERERVPRWVVDLVFLAMIFACVVLWARLHAPLDSGPMIFTPLTR